ncbi:MAG: WbqC family protein [Deltaproteobacteria bacterium]|nr:WbqC family protein [Deltaproteobacteria bacterium]
MKTIAILQPMFIPYLGYFEQMALTDLFVYLDDVQYTRKDWRNRNRVKTANGWIWLTVPVKKCPRDTLLGDVVINYEQDWVRRHLKTLEVAYKKAPFFHPLYDEIKDILESGITNLVQLDVVLLQCLRKHLKITTPERFSSSVPRRATNKNERIMEICRYFDADLLYDGKSAAEFIDRDLFAARGLEVIFQDYAHAHYPQQFDGFIPNLSAVDVIFNTGPEARNIMLDRGDPLAKMRTRNGFRRNTKQ